MSLFRLSFPSPLPVLLAVVGSASFACQEDVPRGAGGSGAGISGGNASANPAGGGSTTGTEAPQANGASSTTNGTTVGQSTGSGSGSSGTTSNALPCDVAGVFAEHCSSCHGSQTQFGAPMSLVTHANLISERNGANVYETVLARVNDDARPMPPAPNPRLTQQQVNLVSSWVAAGAPAAPPGTRCEGSGGSTATAGVARETPSSPSDCQDFYELTAHGGTTSSDPSPHGVSAVPPKNNNEYHCFYFKPPYGVGDEALWFEPIIDNSKVLHHWLLYGTDTMLQADGSSMPCDASEEGAYLLAGWAPGAGTRVMPEGVAMQMPTSGLILELHYYNNSGVAQGDRSGVRFCTAPRGTRPNLAGVHFTGTEGICLPPGQTREVTGECRPSNPQTIHIIDIWPHMHELGVQMTLAVNRTNGRREVIHDAPFDFNSQVGYATDVMMQPGDTLTTTCRYANTTGKEVPFGETTQEEMCYGFVTAWPVGSLQMNQGLLSGTQPARRCMDGLSVMGSCGQLCDAPGYEALEFLLGPQGCKGQ